MPIASARRIFDPVRPLDTYLVCGSEVDYSPGVAKHFRIRADFERRHVILEPWQHTCTRKDLGKVGTTEYFMYQLSDRRIYVSKQEIDGVPDGVRILTVKELPQAIRNVASPSRARKSTGAERSMSVSCEVSRPRRPH